MALVEGVGGKGRPVFPDFLEHRRIVAVRISAGHELGIHVIQLVDELFTHRLTEVVAFRRG